MQNPTRPDFLDDADLEIDAPGEDPGEEPEVPNVLSPGGNSTAASNGTAADSEEKLKASSDRKHHTKEEMVNFLKKRYQQKP